ncbi:MAG: HAD-IB family hydrolase [Bacillota bacterium]|nr:HAD-IB family hydrolase [Bacillota bacterium]
MVKLAIFDVDYTLTKRETLAEFYLFMILKKPTLIRHLPFGVGSFLLYVLGIIDASRSKQNFIRFINGIKEEDMKIYVKEFYEKRMSKIIYRDAIDTMRKLKQQGCLIYLISASGDFYLNELYNIKEVDKIIGTKFRVENGVFRNKIEGLNNKGEEKVRRLMEVLKEDGHEVDFKNSYMFSDSMADLPLFKLVGHPYLINARKKKNNIEILRWR